MPRSPSLDVLVDMRCGLCVLTAKFLHTLDWSRALALRNYHDPAVRAALVPEVPISELERSMHVIDRRTGSVYQGFDALRICASQLPLLWPLALVLYIPGISHFGRFLYVWVAAHRHGKML